MKHTKSKIKRSYLPTVRTYTTDHHGKFQTKVYLGVNFGGKDLYEFIPGGIGFHMTLAYNMYKAMDEFFKKNKLYGKHSSNSRDDS